MATFNGIDLLSEAGDAGALLYLSRAPELLEHQASGVQWLADGVEVEMRAGVRAVVARGLSASTQDEAFEAGLDAVQAGLDLLAARGVASAAVAEADAERFVWWSDDEGRYIRFIGSAILPLEVGQVRILVDGQPPAPAPVPTEPHPSMRYFRLAQVTGDLTDAWRNMYLAVECLLDDICPQRQEGEGAWVLRAFATAHQRHDLSQFAPDGPGDIEARLKSRYYTDRRLPLFHSKQSRSRGSLSSRRERDELQAAYGHLSSMYLYLLRNVAGVRYASSGYFASGFRMLAEGMGLNTAFLTDDTHRELSATEVAVRPGYGLLSTPLTRTPEFDVPFYVAYRGEVSVTALHDEMPAVRQVTLATGASPACGFDFEGELDLKGFDLLELVVGPRGVNKQTYRTRYAT